MVKSNLQMTGICSQSQRPIPDWPKVSHRLLLSARALFGVSTVDALQGCRLQPNREVILLGGIEYTEITADHFYSTKAVWNK